MLTILQPDGLPRNAEQIKKIKHEKRAPRNGELKTMGGKTCPQTAHCEQACPRGTCRQSVCWAEAQGRIPAAVTPWEG